MALLGWLLRAILLTVVVNLVLRLFSGRPPARAGGPRPTPGAGGPRRGPIRASGPAAERVGGALVRDPQCGTYIPQSGAIRIGSGADAHYFCSDGCRTAYIAAHPS